MIQEINKVIENEINLILLFTHPITMYKEQKSKSFIRILFSLIYSFKIS